MIFMPLDQDELNDYNVLCTEAGFSKLNLVEANVLKAIVEISQEQDLLPGASHEEVADATGYTPGQIIQAVNFLNAQGFLKGGKL